MYEFVTGPLAWLAFIVFFVGNVVKLVLYVRGLDWKRDRVTYSVNTSYGVRGALRSIAFWLMPFRHPELPQQPGVHPGAVRDAYRADPDPDLPARAQHLFEERWGVRLPSLPEAATDVLTIGVIAAALLLLLRRLGRNHAGAVA